ncbi:MAG TPA: HEAT repeat domain-containing protein [Fimbriiglobus sp.]|jgi:HEAT repeat protein
MSRILPILALAAVSMPVKAVSDDEPTFNGRKMSDWIVMLKEDQTPRKRRAAALALGQIVADHKGEKTVEAAALPPLAKAVRSDPSPAVRGQAASILGQQPADLGAAFVSDLVECLRGEKDPAAKKEVAVALGRFGPLSRAAVLALIGALKEPDAGAKAAVADALGRIGPDAKAAAAALIPLVKDADTGVRRAAIFALGRIDPDDPGPVSAALVATMKAEKNRDLRLETVTALGLLGDRSPEAVEAIALALIEKDVDLRRQAVRSLGKLGRAAKLVTPKLKQVATSDADKDVRLDTIHTLGIAFGLEAKELIPFLTERLKADPAFEVRIGIAEDLGALGQAGKDALPALRAAETDSQIKVRAAAAAAVKQIEKSGGK